MIVSRRERETDSTIKEVMFVGEEGSSLLDDSQKGKRKDGS